MRLSTIVLALGLAAFAGGPGSAQDQQAAGEQQQPAPTLLDAGQLDQLVAPVALYADPLLAQVLMASTYPLEVVQADRFAKANKGLQGDKLDAALAKQDWDPNVKDLVSTPTVLAMMSTELEWTQSLGDAVLAQQADVMDAIQRLRSQAQANGKLETTEQQTVTVTQEAEQPVIVIEPASPEVIYVPYYDPAVVYGAWPYPTYPPYYFPPAPGYIVGGAIVSGIAWGAGFVIGNAIWGDFDWRHGNINVDIDRNVNINRNNVHYSKWEHNSYHRRGVSYNNTQVRNKFGNANARPGDRKLDYRGHSGNQVLKPGSGDRPNLGGGDGPGGKPGGADRPNLGAGDRPGGKPGSGDRPGGKGPSGKPDKGQIQQGLKERPGKEAALPSQKPALGKAKPASRPGGNGFDPSDGAKAKDFSKRGQASLGNRGAGQFSKPSGGGAKAIHKGGGGGGGGGQHLGGGGRGGGHGGGGRRR
jgi:hypothetical protein